MNIDFNADGTARALYSEDIDLRVLGPLTIERASTVEFCERDQVWEVRLPNDGPVVHRNASRNECLEWERENL